MTVICAILDNLTGKIHYGSDTLATSAYGMKTDIGSKWIKLNDIWMVGVSGHLRTHSVFKEKIEKFADIKDVYDFSRVAKEVLKEDGFERDKDCTSFDLGQTAILIGKGIGVFFIGTDFAIIPIQPNVMWSCGSGQPFALGVYHAMKSTSWPRNLENDMSFIMPENMIKTAIEAAIEYDNGCGGSAVLGVL